MNDDPQEPLSNVIPVWGLTPDECKKIIVFADELISQGRVSGVKEKRLRTYICIYDMDGGPYTIMREQRIMHLQDPVGNLLMIGEKIEIILEMLEACLPEVDAAVGEAI
jgi:hypothetical protein